MHGTSVAPSSPMCPSLLLTWGLITGREQQEQGIASGFTEACRKQKLSLQSTVKHGEADCTFSREPLTVAPVG